MLLVNKKNPNYFIILCFILMLCFTMFSCSNVSYPLINFNNPSSNLLNASYKASDKLAKGLKSKGFDKEGSILAASFVNINNLQESCTLGRILTEQISSRLAQHNYKIIEMKLRQDSVFIKEKKGEFILSRNLQQIGEIHKAHAVLVGTYAISEFVLFVSARIVNTENNTVISCYDFQLPIDYIIRSLIKE